MLRAIFLFPNARSAYAACQETTWAYMLFSRAVINLHWLPKFHPSSERLQPPTLHCPEPRTHIRNLRMRAPAQQHIHTESFHQGAPIMHGSSHCAAPPTMSIMASSPNLKRVILCENAIDRCLPEMVLPKDGSFGDLLTFTDAIRVQVQVHFAFEVAQRQRAHREEAFDKACA